MQRWQRQLALFCLITGLSYLGMVLPRVDILGGRSPLQPVMAQSAQRRAIAASVYTLLPEFPLENHYLSTETGVVDEGNTLVYRLIQYHQNVQSRPLTSRFDWKLTLADYMGVNEWIDEDRYPDRFLQSNPFHQDVEVIRSLNRQQREELTQAVLTALNF